MIEQYNAFISYRHVKRDIKVAKEIQEQLENYKIPKEIAELTGISKIDRIFRDKSELPITSNLTDDIKTALENSEYLIVICSPQTRGSLWIQREIELFLQSHPQNHVLTVLSEGEPGEVIPKVLLSRNVTAETETGDKVTVKEQIEPLSCDYRLPFGKARKEELPRLAAALIGCSYDELVQRANQYRLRRLRITAASVAAVSMAAVSYLIWSNHQIRTNLEQSQINMSMYLADQSLSALDDQDRIGAIQYALDALPKENDNRPVIAEAQYALAKAIGVYDIPGPAEYTAEKRIETGSFIKEFLISPSKDRMASIDRDNTVYLWDLSNDELIATLKNTHTSTIINGYEHGFFLISENYTSLHEWDAGLTVWKNSVNADSDSLVFDENSELIARLSYTDMNVFDLSGNTVYSYSFDDSYSEGSYYSYTPDLVKLNAEGNLAVCSFGDWDESYVVLIDLENHTQTVIADQLGIVDYLGFADSGDILIAEFGNTMYETSEESFYNMYSVFNMNENISLYETSGKLLWKKTIQFDQAGGRTMEQTDFMDDQSNIHKGLICNLGYLQVLLNIQDGSVYKSIEWPAAVRQVIMKNEDTCFSLLENGDLAINSYNESSSGLHIFVNDTQKALTFKNEAGEMPCFMVLPETKPYLIKYVPTTDPEGYELLADIQPSSIEQAYIRGRYAVYSYRDELSDGYIDIYDIEDKRVLGTYPAVDPKNVQAEFSENGKVLYLLAGEDYYTPAVREISLPEMTEKTTILIEDDKYLTEYYCELKGDTARCLYVNETLDVHFDEETGEITINDENTVYDLEFVSFDMKQGKFISEAVILIDEWQRDWKLVSWLISDDGENCLLDIRKESDGEELYELCLVNHIKGNTGMILLDTSETPHYKSAFSNNGTELAVPIGNELRIIDLNGNVKKTVSFSDDSYLSVAYINEDLCLLTTENKIYRYDSGKKLIREYTVGNIENASYNVSDVYTWEVRDNTLYLHNRSILSDILNVVELDQNQSKAVIIQCIGYDIDSQKVLIEDDPMRASRSSSFMDCLGVMKLYSTDELIQLGRSVAGEDNH